MPQFLQMESLFYGTFGPIGALVAILKLIEYVEPLIFLAGRELTQHRGKKRLLCTLSAIYMLKIFDMFTKDQHFCIIFKMLFSFSPKVFFCNYF